MASVEDLVEATAGRRRDTPILVRVVRRRLHEGPQARQRRLVPPPPRPGRLATVTTRRSRAGARQRRDGFAARALDLGKKFVGVVFCMLFIQRGRDAKL